MGFELVALIVAIWIAGAPQLALRAPPLDGAAAWRSIAGGPGFRPQYRDVTNWRFESARHIDASASFALSVLAGKTPSTVSRCVKLNNYWCIKRAGWAGEIAADAEGHVAFASAAEGAQTAALLLRRYYLDYGRRTAMAILSHWAPAQCGAVSRGGGRPISLAIGPLGGTLRARWLAAHRGGPGRISLRRSVIADHPLALMRAPSIEAGVSEIPLPTISLSLFNLPEPAGNAAPRSAPATSCASENQRIANYAARAIPGVAANPTDDLKLFDAAGRPTANLARFMVNMAAVEIGPLRADPNLVALAVTEADAARTAAAADRKAGPQGALKGRR